MSKHLSNQRMHSDKNHTHAFNANFEKELFFAMINWVNCSFLVQKKKELQENFHSGHNHMTTVDMILFFFFVADKLKHRTATMEHVRERKNFEYWVSMNSHCTGYMCTQCCRVDIYLFYPIVFTSLYGQADMMEELKETFSFLFVLFFFIISSFLWFNKRTESKWICWKTQTHVDWILLFLLFF